MLQPNTKSRVAPAEALRGPEMLQAIVPPKVESSEKEGGNFPFADLN